MNKDQIISALDNGLDIVKYLNNQQVYKDGAEWTAIMDLISSYDRAKRVFERRNKNE